MTSALVSLNLIAKLWQYFLFKNENDLKSKDFVECKVNKV